MIGSAQNSPTRGFGTYENGEGPGYYAQQRWYDGNGRFSTADPYEGSGGAGEPGSWNRYTYVGGDPVNWGDPRGMVKQSVCYWRSDITVSEGVFSWSGTQSYTCDDTYSGGLEYPPSPPYEVADTSLDERLTKQYRKLLASRIEQLGSCTRIPGGASASDLAAVANTISYYSGRPDDPGSGRTQDSIVHNGGNLNLFETAQYAVAAVLSSKDGNIVPHVVLGRDFFNDPKVSQADVLLHEALHVAFNLGGGRDIFLKTYLADFGFRIGYGDTGGTDDITQWLKDGCPDLRRRGAGGRR